MADSMFPLNPSENTQKPVFSSFSVSITSGEIHAHDAGVTGYTTDVKLGSPDTKRYALVATFAQSGIQIIN